MAAKIVGGAKGAVSFATGSGEAGQSLAINEWTATVDREIFDTTNFDGLDNWRTKLGGMAHLTGSATGFFDADTTTAGAINKISAFSTQDDAADAAIVLTAYTGKTFTFTGIISNLTTGVVKTGGPVSISFNFESSGAVSEA